MEAIHYSRCRMIPTPSALPSSLGLLADWSRVDDGPPVRVEFGDFDHKQDRYWMRHAGSTKGTWARSEGADTRVVALSAWQSRESVYVRSDSSIHTPSDLDGMRVALPRIRERVFDVERHVYLMPLYNCLTSAGLALGRVRIVDTEFVRPQIRDEATVEPSNFFDDAAATFARQVLSGEVDAFVGMLPPALAGDTRFRSIYDQRLDPRLQVRGELRALTVSGALLREHRKVAVLAVARLLRASGWAAAHPAEIEPCLARELHLDPSGLQVREIDRASWAQVDCTSEQLECLRARKDALLAIGSISRDFPVEEWVDPTVVLEARELMSALQEH